MPHPLCTYTLRVLYACGREFLPSVYFLPITWNGISPPKVTQIAGKLIRVCTQLRFTKTVVQQVI